VSYANGDDGGPKWLGDDADQALAHLLGVQLRDGGEEAARAVAEVSRAVGIKPAKKVSGFTAGARCPRPPKVEVPKGWRWLATGRNMGALAPKAQFDPNLGDHALAKYPETESELQRARDALQRGFAGSALAIARNVYATLYEDETTLVLRDAYAALERPFLVARAEAYIARREAERTTAKRKRS
jgi:hypothetical protein